MRRTRVSAAVALVASVALLAACSNGDPDPTDPADPGTETTDPGDDPDPVTITWWHNANEEPGRGFWQTVADEFVAENPHVTIEVEAIQNEDLRTQLQVALQSNDPPDLFQAWGGGEMAEQVQAGLLKDLTPDLGDTADSLGGTVAGWSVEGSVYGLPYTLGIVGFWYNTALFADAGFDSPPETLDELADVVEALKAIDVEPIAVGAGDVWPAAFWYGYTALRTCGAEKLDAELVALEFTDPCWVEAGELLEEIVGWEPFNTGFLGTPAQTGAGSSAGLVANGLAGMELMGHWNPAVMRGLTDDEQGLGDDLGWFPFPSAPGTNGTQDAVLGGGDGFSCAADAPDECVDFLRYVVSPDVQNRYAAEIGQLPTASGAADYLDDEVLKQVAQYASASSYAHLYLDVAYGPTVGNALNDAVVDHLFAGGGTPEQVVADIQAAV